MDGELAHWDSWGWLGDRTVCRPEPSTAPEQAMDLLLEKTRLIHGEQDWSAWTWEAREYGTGPRTPETVRFRFSGRTFDRVQRTS